MTTVLIVEGNTPEITDATRAAGRPTSAEGYGAALIHFSPGLEIRMTQPYAPGWTIDRVDFDGVDGLVVTGSAAEWTGGDEKSRPFWQVYEGAFSRGIPALGSCWGLQTAAVTLGGETAAGPNGREVSFARNVSLTAEGAAHPLHRGRADTFDVLCMHRDDVTRVPDGAIVTATNAHTAVQGMVYEQGDTKFWGIQYHPEVTLDEVAFWLSADHTASDGGKRMVADYCAIAEDPAGTADLRAKHRVGPDILDFDRHGVELRNWLVHAVGV
ncbi:MAG: type 1 glutamine amidotransferase [Pseudomonadota bacterium]